MEATIGKIKKVLAHIENVQRNCYKLGMKLLELGQSEGRILIANGQIHDNSKLVGIEFDHLVTGSPLLHDVIKHHATTNPHHPEYWGGIANMPDVYIAEMVCDCTARSQEFGQDIRQWFDTKARAKYGFEWSDRVGTRIQYYLNLLLETPFK